jgi:hypothetical protein
MEKASEAIYLTGAGYNGKTAANACLTDVSVLRKKYYDEMR